MRSDPARALGGFALGGFALVATLLTLATPAAAWTENHVTGDEVRIELDRNGKAAVEHRLHVRLNGNERQTKWRLVGVDADAAALPNSYVVPETDTFSSNLDAATPISLTLVPARTHKNGASAPPILEIGVDRAAAMKRGPYVFVVRYETDLAAAGRLVRDGALVRLDWTGPVLDDGIDNARVVVAIPSAPNPPRPYELGVASNEAPADEDGELAPMLLHDLRRTADLDELELLRAFAPQGESVLWQIRFDPRALDAPPEAPPQPEMRPAPRPVAVGAAPEDRLPWLAGASGLFALYALLLTIKWLQLRRRAAEASAEVKPLVPLPLWLRAPIASAAVVAGVGLQLFLGRALAGALCILGATILALHRSPRSRAAGRGPGRWLTVGVAEGVRVPPRPRGALVDTSTRAGKLLFLLLLGAVGAAAYLLGQTAPLQAWLVGLDAVALLALFGTGRLSGLPPDLSLEPARFLRGLVRRLRKLKGASELRLAARIRVPQGALDPDELRLLVAPRQPLRGFTGIEVGVGFALGFGTRVAMPEILVRMVDGSACHEALAPLAARGRLTPGRKPDERVLAVTPRLPTLRMTAAIVAALAARVLDRAAVSQAPVSAKKAKSAADDRRKRAAAAKSVKPAKRAKRGASEAA